MNDSLVKKIIKNKLPCYFISPHLDDAALSAASLISFLSRRTSVTVINVFTSSDTGPSTLSARRFVGKTGYSTASALYAERRHEDSLAWKQLGVKVINLGFTDALWRRKQTSFIGKFLPEVDHVYPIYRLQIKSGKISPSDNALVNEVSDSIKTIVNNNPKSVVFCPYGVGNHVDHKVVKKAVERIFNPVYWHDQHYLHFSKDSFPISFTFPINQSQKIKLLNQYKTQIGLLFPKGHIPELKEQFFYKDKK